MTSKVHHKHPKIAKAFSGYFHRNEWAILGSSCGIIKTVAKQLQSSVQNLKSVYIDADHHSESASFSSKDGKMLMDFNKHQLQNDYDVQLHCSSVDFVLANGNHYRANNQIIIIDKEKETSLEKRLSQCSNIEMVLIKDGAEIFPFVKKLLDATKADIPVFKLEDVDSFTKQFLKLVNQKTPELNALILAGGESKRMGEDKSQLEFHGTAHELHLAQLCSDLGIKTYISKYKDYDSTIAYSVIKDVFVGMGPFGAICSAMMHNPNTAWLVIACDLPFLSKELIQELISNRDISKIATTIKAKEKDFPEPLVTIYEPKAYQRFLEFLSKGISCPRKVVINSDVKVMAIDDETLISNVNTPQEYKAALSSIGNES